MPQKHLHHNMAYPKERVNPGLGPKNRGLGPPKIPWANWRFFSPRKKWRHEKTPTENGFFGGSPPCISRTIAYTYKSYIRGPLIKFSICKDRSRGPSFFICLKIIWFCLKMVALKKGHRFHWIMIVGKKSSWGFKSSDPPLMANLREKRTRCLRSSQNVKLKKKGSFQVCLMVVEV